MKPIQKPGIGQDKPKASNTRVHLSIVSDKERQDARISTYGYILP